VVTGAGRAVVTGMSAVVTGMSAVVTGMSAVVTGMSAVVTGMSAVVRRRCMRTVVSHETRRRKQQHRKGYGAEGA
jgi:membrane protein implicated in regulation of membrane protease activity